MRRILALVFAIENCKIIFTSVSVSDHYYGVYSSVTDFIHSLPFGFHWIAHVNVCAIVCYRTRYDAALVYRQKELNCDVLRH